MVLQKDIDKEIIKLKYLKADHGIFLDIFVFEDTEERTQYHSFCVVVFGHEDTSQKRNVSLEEISIEALGGVWTR